MISPDKKKKIIFFAKLITAFALILFFVSTLKPEEIYNVLKRADGTLLSVVFILGMVNIFIQYVKWKSLCNNILEEKNERKIIKSLFAGFSAGIMTPMRAGEFWGRFLAFTNGSFLKLTYAVVLDKFSLLFVEVVFGGILSIIFVYYYINLGAILFAIIILLYIIVTLIFLLIINGKIGERKYVKALFYRYDKLKTIYDKYMVFRVTDNKQRIKIILLSVLQYSCFISQYILLVCSFTLKTDIFSYMIAAGFLFFAKNLISFLTPGELGTREGLSVFTLTLAGINGAAAFNAAFTLFIVNILLPAIAGLFFLVSKDDN